MIIPKFVYDEIIKLKTNKAFESGYRKAILDIHSRITTIIPDERMISKEALLEIIEEHL